MLVNPTRRPKIVLIGDLLVDVWWLAEPNTKNVEHAAMALRSLPANCTILPGGVGILIDAFRHAPVDLCVYSVVGGAGPYANTMLADLRHKAVNLANVLVDPKFITPVKTRYINENGHILLRHDSEYVQPTAQTFGPQLERDIETADVVVVSDYGKGCINNTTRRRISTACRDLGTPLFVDTKPAFATEYPFVTGFKLNRAETETIAGIGQDGLPAIMQAAQQRLNCPLLITTDGAKGAGWITHDTRDFLADASGFVSSPARYVAGNCVGAGDIFFVGFILGVLSLAKTTIARLPPADLERAIHVGLIAAGQRVRTNSAQPFSFEELQAELQSITQQFNPARKILPYHEFCRLAVEKRNAGQRVVLTNGCFDLLHAGHVHLLSWARQRGDALFVAVDSDVNVRRLKGADRPVHDQNTRATNVAALESVDAVYVFDEQFPDTHDSLRNIVGEVQPSVLVKGAEYAGKEVVGQDIAESVLLCPMLPGKSTTVFVNKLKAVT